MFAMTSALLLSVAVLVIPIYATAQTTLPPLPPGWYRNEATGPFFTAKPGDNLEGLTIQWEDSYLYPYPGNDPLYWYAQMVYRNEGRKTLTIWCTGRADPSLAKEHIRGDSGYIGYVPADEDFCSRNPNLTFLLKPGESYYGWVIFHNVPWGRRERRGRCL